MKREPNFNLTKQKICVGINGRPFEETGGYCNDDVPPGKIGFTTTPNVMEENISTG